MASRTIQDQIDELLRKRLAEARIKGVPSPDIEAAALFESIAINLILNPRAVLYIALLAKNGLQKSITDEIEAIQTLKVTIQDLSNVSFSIKDTRNLEKAKNSLLDIEGQDKVDSGGTSFRKFDLAVSEFLNKELKKNVVRPGSTEMTRPSEEAKIDLSIELASLKDLHADFLDRLYALRVGVTNFLTTPLSTIIGLSTASRARQDIEAIIDELSESSSASQSRDIAVRLIASRAALRILGATPTINDPVVDTETKLPIGYEITGASAETAVSVTGGSEPFILHTTSPSLTVTDASGSLTETTFPVDLLSLGNNAHLIGTIPSLPLAVGSQLFLTVRSVYGDVEFTLQEDGSYTSSTADIVSAGFEEYWFKNQTDGTYYKQVKVVLNDGVTPVTTVSLLKSTITAAFSSATLGSAIEFPQAGSGKILIYVNRTHFDRVEVSSSFVQFDVVAVPIITPTIYVTSRSYATTTTHESFDLKAGQAGISGTTPLDTIVTALNSFFGAKLTASSPLNTSGVRVLHLLGVDTDPGAFLTFSGNAATNLGILGTFQATSNEMILSGSINGVDSDVINPISLVDIGDVVTTPVGDTEISSITDSKIILGDSLETFEGDITIKSILAEVWSGLDAALASILKVWLKTSYKNDIKKIDAIISILVGSATSAQQNLAIAELSVLEDQLTTILDSISSIVLPAFSAKNDRQIVSGIISTLTERKYDRAIDLLSRCKIQEVFELDHQAASYGGAFIKAASNVAQTDINFPNRALVDTEVATAIITRRRT